MQRRGGVRNALDDLFSGETPHFDGGLRNNAEWLDDINVAEPLLIPENRDILRQIAAILIEIGNNVCCHGVI